MKWMSKAMVAMMALFAVGASHADSLRHGTVMALKPIDNRGQDESQVHQTGRQIGRALGNFFGAKVATETHSGEAMVATTAVVPAAGEAAGGAIAGQGPAAHYMVQIRLDDGRVIALVQTGNQVEGLAVGRPVSIAGEGASAQITAE